MSSSQTFAVSGNICHILPCSIDEDITAPVAQYFHPTTVSTSTHSPKNEVSKDGERDITIMAAQFRGRGLLCATDAVHGEDSIDLTKEGGQSTNNGKTTDNIDPSSTADSSPSEQSHKRPLSKLPSTMIGVVFNNTQTSNINNHSNHNKKDPPMQPLTTIETFSHVYNWRHEHDETKVMRESRFGSNDKEGLNAVLGWCDVAHAVHDAVPLPEE